MFYRSTVLKAEEEEIPNGWEERKSHVVLISGDVLIGVCFLMIRTHGSRTYKPLQGKKTTVPQSYD